MEKINESDGELPFDRYEYCSGFTLYAFDFTAGHTGRGALSLVRNGNLNLNMRFKVALPETVVCVAYMTYDNILEISNNRKIMFDFAP